MSKSKSYSKVSLLKVPRTYPESFRVIAQTLKEKIDYDIVFQGMRLKIARAIQLHYSADL